MAMRFQRDVYPVILAGILMCTGTGVRPISAMDADSFAGTVALIEREPRGSNKLGILIATGRDHTFESRQLARLLELLSFNSDRLSAVKELRNRIEDPENKSAIIEVFRSTSDRKKAAGLLEGIRANKQEPCDICK